MHRVPFTGWAEFVHRSGRARLFQIRDHRGDGLGLVEVVQESDREWRWVRVDLEGSAGVFRGDALRGLTAAQIARRAWHLSESEMPTNLPDLDDLAAK